MTGASKIASITQQERATPPAVASDGHFRDLDGLRGILAVTVMFYHYGVNVVIAQVTRGAVTSAPWGAMVDFFFILSGFVLTKAYTRSKRTFPQVVVERAFRLLPVHLVLMAAFAPIFSNIYNHSSSEVLADWMALAVFTGADRWNGPSWSIGIELYLSVLLASAAIPLQRASSRAAWLSLAVLMLASSFLSWRLALGEDNFVPRGFVGLATGALLFRCSADISPPTFGKAWLLPALTAAMYGCVLLSGVHPAAGMVTPFIMATAIWFGCYSQSFLGRGVFAFVGTLSFTIYMVHECLKRAGLYFLGRSEFGGDLVGKGLLIIAVFPCAWLLTKFIELPAMTYGKRLGQRFARKQTASS